MLTFASEWCARPKKETDAKKPQPLGKVGIRATGLVTNDRLERILFTQVPTVSMRARDAVRHVAGTWRLGAWPAR